MDRRSVTYRIFKAILIILSLPVILLSLAITALYIPPIQQYTIDKVCETISRESGFDINAGKFHLQFPLKLKIADFHVAKEGELYAKGESIAISLELLPLTKGEVEVNYIQLEGITLNSGELIPGLKIDGNVGYFRGVARNVDIKNETANLRQLYLRDSNVNVELCDTAQSDDSTVNWIVTLYKANIENCNANIKMPLDTMAISAGIGKLSLKRLTADLGKESYSIGSIELGNSEASYDQGVKSREEEPLNHLALKNINTGIKDIYYSPQESRIEIKTLSMIQPDGFEIAKACATIIADTTKAQIKHLELQTSNNSCIRAAAEIPWKALTQENEEKLNAGLHLAINKRDLRFILDENEFKQLEIFGDDMFAADIHADGNITRMTLDTIDVNIPTLASLKAKGFVENIYDTENIALGGNIKRLTCDIGKFIGETIAVEHGKPVLVTADGDISYTRNIAKANINLKRKGGKITANATYDLNEDAYKADIGISNLRLDDILPDVPLKRADMKVTARGKGLDLFNDMTYYSINARLDSVIYDKYTLFGININAMQEKGLSTVDVTGDAKELLFSINARTELKRENIKNSTAIEILEANLQKIGVSEDIPNAALKLNLEAATDLKESHAVKFNGKEIRIDTGNETFTPEDINFEFSTTPEQTHLVADNGDLHISGEMKCGYSRLFSTLEDFGDIFADVQHSDRPLYHFRNYEKEFPYIKFNLNCNQNNILYNFMAMNEMSMEKLFIGITFKSTKELYLNGQLINFKAGDIQLDTVRMFTHQYNDRSDFLTLVRSTAINPLREKETYSASLRCKIYDDSLTTEFKYRDREEGIRMDLGATTTFQQQAVNISFKENAYLFGKKFNFNKHNFLKIGKDMSIDADVSLTNKNNAGLHLFTTPDVDAKYNANLELYDLNLKEITDLIPYSPEISGTLNMDLFFRQDEKSMVLSTDASLDSISYEGSYIGNETIELVYFPKEENKHYIDLRMNHDDKEILGINGDYINDKDKPGLDGNIALKDFPLAIANAFVKESGIEIEGFINSDLAAVGPLSSLTTNGHMQFDKVSLDAPAYGTGIRLADNRLNIDNNKIEFKNFNIYTTGENPFRIEGTVDISELSNPAFNLRMNAANYEVINSPRKKGAMLYGKLLIDFAARINGSLNDMRINGNASMLRKSDITYVLLDGPISSDKELDGLVEFVNFQDTTEVKQVSEGIDIGNMHVNLGLKIEDGAKINADLDENRNSYLTLQGNGDLNMTYNEAGLNVSGSYTMNEGELKYELPIIPLKTFNIENGSKVTWNGDILNPTLNIVALERITTSVTFDDNNIQPVAFDVGIKLSNTLSRIGLSFTISAPENAIVQDQLNSLDEETLNKYAITMLITGTYIGGANGMTVSNALSSFLDAKINELAGNAMKSVSVNIGINNAQNAETGDAYKNYSFSFRKRFWNDRITIVIGGEVNSGNTATGNESFINNVSLEWKISNSGNRHLRLFYDKNFESLLEGEIIETGIGYIYKRKLNNLRELFIFDNKKNNTAPAGEKKKRK